LSYRDPAKKEKQSSLQDGLSYWELLNRKGFSEKVSLRQEQNKHRSKIKEAVRKYSEALGSRPDICKSAATTVDSFVESLSENARLLISKNDIEALQRLLQREIKAAIVATKLGLDRYEER